MNMLTPTATDCKREASVNNGIFNLQPPQVHHCALLRLTSALFEDAAIRDSMISQSCQVAYQPNVLSSLETNQTRLAPFN